LRPAAYRIAEVRRNMKTRALSPGLEIQARIRPVTKISISEAIAQQIMDLIANGELKPGQRLPSERELCKDFGAGRSSLREALRCLSIMGVLNARVGEGTSVALDGEKFLGKIVEWRLITEKHDIENLLEVRIALEGVAAAKAAAFAGEQDIALIDALIGRMKEAVDDAKRFAALDLEFHVALAKASGNALLFDLVSMIRGQLARGLSKVLHVPDALPLSLKEHIAIAEAIRRGNSAAAQKAMQAHLGDALKRYDDAMEKQMPVRRSAPRGAKSR